MKKHENSQWRLSKYRYQELRNFCLQYPDWEKELLSLHKQYKNVGLYGATIEPDPTGEVAVRINSLRERIKQVHEAAFQVVGGTPREGWYSLVELVTHKSRDISCENDLGSDVRELYQMFFWHLDKIHD